VFQPGSQKFKFHIRVSVRVQIPLEQQLDYNFSSAAASRHVFSNWENKQAVAEF
jgi:hypothetical protein